MKETFTVIADVCREQGDEESCAIHKSRFVERRFTCRGSFAEVVFQRATTRMWAC